MSTSSKILRRIERGWYQPGLINWLLLPLSWVYCLLAMLHRWYWNGLPRQPEKVDAPVVIVGNITVGGTGKTPLVVALARRLVAQGYRPGIISRGYGGSVADTPRLVGADDGADLVGDEPVLMRRRSGVPVAVGRDRVAAAELLLRSQGCDVIVSDDGLQHRRLQRDIGIVVIDGSRGLGNGWCLPAGPLREPASALHRADIRVANGPGVTADFVMSMVAVELHTLDHSQAGLSPDGLSGRTVHAVAGTGNPERFFRQLEACGLLIERHPFPDHHRFTAADFAFADGHSVVLMTEKDAVKCENLTIPGSVYYLPVEAELPPAFFERILTTLSSTIR